MVLSDSQCDIMLDAGDVRSNRLIPTVAAVYEVSSAGLFIISYESDVLLRNSLFYNNYSPKVQSCLFLKA